MKLSCHIGKAAAMVVGKDLQFSRQAQNGTRIDSQEWLTNCMCILLLFNYDLLNAASSVRIC